MSWKEFEYTILGHNLRIERNWDYVRTLLSAQYSTAFGAKKALTPTQIMHLPNIDRKQKVEVRNDDIGKKIAPERLSKLMKVLDTNNKS